MYNLLDTPGEADYQVPVINGHFELSGWPDTEDYNIT
jgi:hypothetical protein